MDFKERYCKLCRCTIHGENSETLQNIAKDILGVPLLKLDVDDEIKHAVCNVCSEKFFAVQKFKLTCIYTDNVINSYAKANSTAIFPLDLQEIYMKGRANEDISDITKICRLCMEPVKNISEFKLINEEHVDMILKFVPEMNIFMIKQPIVCIFCLDSLAMYCDLLKESSHMEQNIKNSPTKKTPFVPYFLPPLGTYLKTDDVDIKFEEDAHHLIESRSMGIICDKIEDEGEIHGHKTSGDAAAALKNHGTRCYKCNNFQTNSASSPNGNEIIRPKHKILPMCKFDSETMIAETSLRNKLVYKDDSEVLMYKCAYCNFQTKQVHQLISHLLIHKEASEVQTYKCEDCDYETKHKANLKKHIIIHKDLSEVQMYECENCHYKSRHKNALAQHMLKHKKSSEVPLYRCLNCNYETIYKGNLKSHILAMHTTSLDVKMYKCESCNYGTNNMIHLRKHVLIHKDPLEVHECKICNFKTKYKSNLKKHIIIHKDLSEVQMYECENCHYKSRHKNALALHMLKHKKSSEVPVYKCANCNYETIYKGNLKSHILAMHATSSLEVEGYK